MISMEMTDENVIDSGCFDLIFSGLNLHSLPTVQQQKILPKSKDLGSVISPMNWDG
jgi:hypothetical protein